jgi:hypothetical protein
VLHYPSIHAANIKEVWLRFLAAQSNEVKRVERHQFCDEHLVGLQIANRCDIYHNGRMISEGYCLGAKSAVIMYYLTDQKGLPKA